MRGPRPRYDALVEAGELANDPAQEAAADRLQTLHDALKGYKGPRNGWFGGRKDPPEGVYLWGGVGRGKTLLMDLFFNNTPFHRKRRAHFHEFMADAHERIAAWRALPAAEKKKHKAYDRASPDDPMPPVAHDLAREALLLCFDEFHVTDIADAMILGRLFTALLEHGVVVVATSNRTPDDLYKDGLNRQLFLPFIELLKSSLDILELQSAQDYRLAKLTAAPVYYAPLGPEADMAMDAAWTRMLSGGHERREDIALKGRKLIVPRAGRGAARFDFAELCERPLGASDYLALARRYGALFIDHIPIMGPDERNEAKRFSTLIDTLYDARVKLVCSADGEPDDLYRDGHGAFEFERTASRLMEMRTGDYLSAATAAPAERSE
ncbi:cell division protein ZapE [Hyphococcus luteus]|uniref:Cell division protein ZapE n=1 Tax=Hyphococcus luteus TaxID=2058213 RepID=A0A2S7K673_9PROT|nr:cell division protein ZapE [Marinicaulis flavus]PQA88003.1 cell division protein ZapE [Marinicaulis flavus]